MSVSEEDYVILKPPDEVKTRLPIEALMSMGDYKKQRDLFLQGFSKVQEQDYNLLKSFYKVAGIHGLPYDPYNEPQKDKSDNKFGGYCHHSDILFPTWHRPYVALLEMLIRDAASQIIEDSGTEEGEEYAKALAELRFPYWDWASPSTLCEGMPSIFFDKYVSVDGPNTDIGKIPNPLRAYTLPVNLGNLNLVGDGSNPTQRPYSPDSRNPPYTPVGYATVRHPNKNYLTNMNSTSLQIVTWCSSVFRPSIYEVLKIDDWLHFSNTSGNPSTESSETEKLNYKDHASIEGVHNSLHDAMGGDSGHMGYPDTAGFDPIFFLHHANVDRLVAIWQFIHPNAWIQPNNSNDGNFSVNSNEKLDEFTSLKPFLKNYETYWNSHDVREIKSLGYTYSELEGKDPDEQTDRDDLLKDMQNYYQPLPNTKFRWKIAVTVDKNKVGSPFQIRAFIGLPKNDEFIKPSPPITSPNFAGLISIFARGRDTKCANCINHPNTVVNGSIDLTMCMQRLHFINKKNERKWKPPTLDNKSPNKEEDILKPEDITLAAVLKNENEITLEKAGLRAAYYCRIDDDDIENPKYMHKFYPPEKTTAAAVIY